MSLPALQHEELGGSAAGFDFPLRSVPLRQRGLSLLIGTPTGRAICPQNLSPGQPLRSCRLRGAVFAGVLSSRAAPKTIDPLLNEEVLDSVRSANKKPPFAAASLVQESPLGDS